MTTPRAQIEAEAARLGLLACGVAPLGPNEYGEAGEAWL